MESPPLTEHEALLEIQRIYLAWMKQQITGDEAMMGVGEVLDRVLTVPKGDGDR